MEHIVNFGIVVNDEDIANQVTEMLKQQILEDIHSTYFKVDYYGRTSVADELMKNKIAEFINDNKDFIIESVINKLVEKVGRMKQFKEEINKVKGGNQNV